MIITAFRMAEELSVPRNMTMIFAVGIPLLTDSWQDFRLILHISHLNETNLPPQKTNTVSFRRKICISSVHHRV
jgi:hypothetical protein